MSGEWLGRTALLSLLANLAFAFFTGWIGIAGRSWWFVTLAAYYIILSVMRFAVLLFHRRSGEEAGTGLFIMRFTGVMFMLLAVTLAGAAYLSFSGDYGVRHHEIVIIAIALYAFIKIGAAITNLVKSRKSTAAALKVLRSISFAGGLVSIFSLQRSMLVTFEGMSTADISLFNALTGSAVYVAVFILGIHLAGGRQ